MLDFGSTKKEPWLATSAGMNELVDAAWCAVMSKETPRDYLGGSRLGVECDRRLGYEYHHVPKDQGRDFPGRVRRIFERGHHCEERMARYLRAAGFELLTEGADGQQFGFGVAKDPETGRDRISGHLDGVITGWASPLPIEQLSQSVLDLIAGMSFPCLWENKGVGKKSFSKYQNSGIKKSSAEYYVQMQTYMAYMGLEKAPALFTAECQDDCTIFAELVPFDLRAAQDGSDKGVRVISTASPEELPRIARDRSDFRCKFCDYPERCWSTPAAPSNAPAAHNPAWLTRA